MTSTLNTQNISAKGSKVPVQLPNTNASTVREDVSGAQAKKPPYESKKSAEELKLRLASAVSAKIALSKDGRNSSSNTSNRGIGFLLQRKEQQENKLNTKDISFQKPLRNQGGKPVEMTGKNPNNSTKNANKSELQKSLLSALMNSRGTLPNKGKDTRGRLNSDTKDKTSTAKKLNETSASTPKATNNVVNKPSNGTISGQNRDSRFANTTKLNPSATNKTKNTVSESNNKPLSTVKTKSEDSPSKLPSEFPNGTRGGILDRAKNIERLLSQRKPNIAVESANGGKNVAVNGKEKNIEANQRMVNGKINNDVKFNTTISTAKAKDVSTIKPLASLGKESDSFVNGRSNGVFALNKTAKATRPFENAAKEKTEHSNGQNKEKFDSNGSVEVKKPFENSGKKIPPPVAKKPSKENMNRSPGLDSQNFLTSTNGYVKISSDPQQTATKINSSPTWGNTGGLKVNGLRSKNETALLLNGTNSAKDTGFRKDLLEKLEADVGRCKIAAFQSMEEFSALRMKVYRVRGELDQLKREREKRTALVC